LQQVRASGFRSGWIEWKVHRPPPPRNPHGRVRPFHLKSTRLTGFFTSIFFLQIWSSELWISEATTSSNFIVWKGISDNVYGLFPTSQGQDLALNFFYGPYSLSSGSGVADFLYSSPAPQRLRPFTCHRPQSCYIISQVVLQKIPENHLRVTSCTEMRTATVLTHKW
jgi:hypothetical protein